MAPLVIAYHLIWTGYGWWLPNDPRGSYSQTIRNDVLKELGDLHLGRKKVQPHSFVIREFYDDARSLLKHSILSFTSTHRSIIANAFARVIAADKYTCYACALMPDHVHILIRKHKQSIEEISQRLHDRSRTAMQSVFANHPIWSGGCGWKVFLEHPDEIRRTIRYIEQNPIKIGLPAQNWDFVTRPYDDWPLHPGHNPDSPWARRLRRR
ncbi:MAG: transposase [Phycisphaerae bacterium]|nr:transposase [Phycisphaerae bacterium]